MAGQIESDRGHTSPMRSPYSRRSVPSRRSMRKPCRKRANCDYSRYFETSKPNGKIKAAGGGPDRGNKGIIRNDRDPNRGAASRRPDSRNADHGEIAIGRLVSGSEEQQGGHRHAAAPGQRHQRRPPRSARQEHGRDISDPGENLLGASDFPKAAAVGNALIDMGPDTLEINSALIGFVVKLDSERQDVQNKLNRLGDDATPRSRRSAESAAVGSRHAGENARQDGRQQAAFHPKHDLHRQAVHDIGDSLGRQCRRRNTRPFWKWGRRMKPSCNRRTQGERAEA